MDCRRCDWFLCKICCKSPQDIKKRRRIPTCGFYAGWSSDNYEMVVEPISVAMAAKQELAMLEAQERQLQSALAQRRSFKGTELEVVLDSSILDHYQSILDNVRQQIAEFSYDITLSE